MPQTNYIIILICDGTTYVCHTYFIVKRKEKRRQRTKIKCSPHASVPQWPHSIRRGCNIFGQILQEPPYFGIFAEMGNVQIDLPEKCERWFISFRVDICFANFDDKSPILSPYQRTTFILCASTLIKEVYII